MNFIIVSLLKSILQKQHGPEVEWYGTSDQAQKEQSQFEFLFTSHIFSEVNTINAN